MRSLVSLILALVLGGPALGVSTVNPGVPGQNTPLNSGPIRGNFLAVYNDINGIESCFLGATAPASPSTFQFWCDTTGAPTNVIVKQWDGSAWVVTGHINQATHTYTAGSGIFSVPQVINLNANALQARQTGTILQMGQANGTLARAELDSYAASSHFTGVRADGTALTPTALQAADAISSFNAFGYNGSAFVGPAAAVRMFADQNWTTGAQGTYVDIATTPDGGTTLAQVAKFGNSGGVQFGTPTGGDEGAGTLNTAGKIYQNGSALTLGGALTTTGAFASTFAFSGAQTYTFPSATDTVDLISQVQTLANKTLTAPTINGAALSGTFSGTPTFSGANFVSLGNIVQDTTAWSLFGNATSGTANYAPFTIGGLSNKASPATTDLLVLQDHTTGQLFNTTVTAVAAGGAVASFGGLTGVITTSTGIVCSGSNCAGTTLGGLSGAITAGNGVSCVTSTCAVSLTSASNVLGSDVTMNNTSNYFDGPSMAQGTTGTWFVHGHATVTDTAAAEVFKCKLWDGTTVISSSQQTSAAALNSIDIALEGILASPAANIRISCNDSTATTGLIKFNISGNSKDSSIWGIRIQ